MLCRAWGLLRGCDIINKKGKINAE